MPTIPTHIDLSLTELGNLCIKPFTYTGSVESIRDLPRDPNIGEVRYASNTGTTLSLIMCWIAKYDIFAFTTSSLK